MSYDLHSTNIPPVERIERYFCKNCQQTFERVFPRRDVCTFVHPPNTCCHYGDTVITRRQLQKERELQQAVEQERVEKEENNEQEKNITSN